MKERCNQSEQVCDVCKVNNPYMAYRIKCVECLFNILNSNESKNDVKRETKSNVRWSIQE